MALSGTRLLQNVVRALLLADAHQHAFLHHVHQVSAQRLGGHVGAQRLVVAVGDAAVIRPSR